MLKKILAATAMLAAAVSPALAQDKTPVTFVQATEGFLQLPLYVAEAKGYFADEGIAAELTVAKGGSAALAAVLGGSGQIYVGIPSTAFLAREKGQDLQTFAGLMNQYASNVVVSGEVAKAAGLTHDTPAEQRLAALKGLKMGITGPGSATDQLTRFLATSGGLDPDRDLTIVPLGNSGAVLAAFSQNRIDGFAFSSPTSDTVVVRDGAFMLLQLTKGEYKPLDGFLYVTMSARNDWLKENPETATKVVRAIESALKLLRENPEDARSAMRSFFPKVDEDVFNAAFDSNLAAYPATARIDAAGVERVFDFMEASDGKRPNLKAEDVFTNDYVNAAHNS